MERRLPKPVMDLVRKVCLCLGNLPHYASLNPQMRHAFSYYLHPRGGHGPEGTMYETTVRGLGDTPWIKELTGVAGAGEEELGLQGGAHELANMPGDHMNPYPRKLTGVAGAGEEELGLDLEELVRKGEVAWLNPADALEDGPGAGSVQGPDPEPYHHAPAADAGGSRKRREAPGNGHSRGMGRGARTPAPDHPARRATPEQVVSPDLGFGSGLAFQPAAQCYRAGANGRGAARPGARASNGAWDPGEAHARDLDPIMGYSRAGQPGPARAHGGGGRAGRDPAVECDPTLDSLGASLGGFGVLPGMPAAAQFPEVPTDAALLSLLGPDFAWT